MSGRKVLKKSISSFIIWFGFGILRVTLRQTQCEQVLILMKEAIKREGIDIFDGHYLAIPRDVLETNRARGAMALFGRRKGVRVLVDASNEENVILFSEDAMEGLAGMELD